jgi:chromosome partitioning protein
VELLKTLNANYRVLLTKVDSRTKNPQDAREFLAQAQLPIFKTEIPLLVAFQRSPSLGVTVKDYPDRRAKTGWYRYQDVGKEILEIMSQK